MYSFSQMTTVEEETMTAKFEHSHVIDRPIDLVFHFVADEHVHNHPRWDPDIHLEQVTPGPLRVGTLIRRRNTRSGTAVEGTMEVVEYEPNRMLAMKIFDGPNEMFGRTTFEAIDDNHTAIHTFVEIPGMDDNMDKSFLMSRLERSGQIRKQLIESEL
jgi:uncharacterized membrane protein